MEVSAGRARLEDALAELLWRRSGEDPRFFMERCLWIPSQRDPRGREPLRLFDYQAADLETFSAERFVVTLKSRQIGLSTLVGAYAMWLCLFKPGSVVLWISNSQDNANKAVGMLDTMWRYLPRWASERAPKLTSDQAGKKEWSFSDGMTSRIRAYAGTGKAGASETASLVVLDEFALVDDQDNLFRSTDPTTDAGGSLWIVSTARGAHNRFAQTFRAAQRGESKFTPIFHPWMVSRFVNPLAGKLAGCRRCRGTGLVDDGEGGRGWCPRCVDATGYESKRREFAEKPWLLSAEYPSEPEEAFRESGRPRFPALPRVGDPSVEEVWVRGDMVEGEDGRLRFEPEERGALRLLPEVAHGAGRWRDYVVFVDPATGTGGDFTAATVLTFDEDALPVRLGWWHANNVEPVDAARRFALLGQWFAGPRGAALLAVESTGGWGDSMLVELQTHLRYPRLYSHRPTGNRRRAVSTKLGFPMHHQRRPMVVDRLAEYVSARGPQGVRLAGLDPLLLGELQTFVRREDGKVAADVGCHDDLVMSTAGALWVLLEDVRATDRPDGEREDAPVEGEGRLDLSAMFEQVERAREREAEQVSRAVRGMRRHRGMRSSRRGGSLGRVR